MYCTRVDYVTFYYIQLLLMNVANITIRTFVLIQSLTINLFFYY